MTIRERTWPWIASEQSHRCRNRQSIRPLGAHDPHWLQHSPPLRQRPQWGENKKYTLKEKRTYSSQTLKGFHFSNWGTDPTPERMATVKEQRGSPAPHSEQALAPPVSTTPHQSDSCQHTLRKDVAAVHINSSPHSKDTGHTVYTIMLPHKSTPLRSQ